VEVITLGARMREGGKMAEKATCFLKVLRVEGTVFPQGSLKSTAVRKEKKIRVFEKRFGCESEVSYIRSPLEMAAD